MKSLIGKTYEELVESLNTSPKRHYYKPGCKDGFSVFFDGNEYLFSDSRLFSIEISDLSAAHRIPGFNFPIGESLEETLCKLKSQQFQWEICRKYSQESWIAISLPECSVRYEFEFVTNRFELRFVRLESY